MPMHQEVLTEEQIELLPLVQRFSRDFGLVGGTAIALQIGHRRSIDFDLFSLEEFKNGRVKRIVTSGGWKIQKAYKDEEGQFTFLIRGVQFTFFHYPFRISFPKRFGRVAKMPDLLTLAAMKAYALGSLAKWNDYVDLHFIMNVLHSMEAVAERAKKIFKGEFNERIFREQLAYFDDIDYSQEVISLPGCEVSEAKIKKGLTEFSLER